MARRADPERIYLARRAAALGRLEGAWLPPERAEELVAAWEQEAAERRLERFSVAYWQAGWEWMAERRASRRAG
jgi:hypothetical protein